MKKIKITNKLQAQSRAIDWQHWQSEQSLGIGELNDWHTYWLEVANKFNLQEEFYENGII